MDLKRKHASEQARTYARTEAQHLIIYTNARVRPLLFDYFSSILSPPLSLIRFPEDHMGSADEFGGFGLGFAGPLPHGGYRWSRYFHGQISSKSVLHFRLEGQFIRG